jgi:hypothetical protein
MHGLNTGILQINVMAGDVVLSARDHCGEPISGRFTAECILASLPLLRAAAETAILARWSLGNPVS